MARCAVDAEE
ncbi:hypothetical protein A2U01_0114175, partial [Trifolium medium]|nr:hypothetical protein [Trifolium medium]